MEEETQEYQFEIYDVEEAITKFKELCQPKFLGTLLFRIHAYTDNML